MPHVVVSVLRTHLCSVHQRAGARVQLAEAEADAVARRDDCDKQLAHLHDLLKKHEQKKHSLRLKLKNIETSIEQCAPFPVDPGLCRASCLCSQFCAAS